LYHPLDYLLLSATSEDLKALDLYSALSALPKHVDPDHDPFEGSGTAVDQTLGKRKAKEPTQREQARMKKKQAVIAKLQEQAQAGEPGSREASLSIPPEDERDTKKIKAEDDAEDS
jgi:tRNA (guanine-N(7)-)-methyltransferase subunit TRM82